MGRGSSAGSRHQGFLLSTVRARIDTANGPAWAAPKEHRMPIHPGYASSLSARDWISQGFHGETRALMNESLPHGCAGCWITVLGRDEYLSYSPLGNLLAEAVNQMHKRG